MGIKLHPNPARFGRGGRKLPRPYILDTYCKTCGMALVADELHSIQACVVFNDGEGAENALWEEAKVARILTLMEAAE